MRKIIRGLIVAAAVLALAACATNIAQEKASRFDQGVAAYDAGDYPQAYAIWSELADENDLAAMRNAANMLRQGKGVAKDPVAAFNLYRTAADKGLVTAMANVAEMYLSGEGTERDPKAAAGWYARAAIAGLSLAQLRLAELYERGVGVEQDHKKAVALLQRAARNGYAPAQQKLRAMGLREVPDDAPIEVPAARGDGTAAPRGEHRRRPQPGDALTDDMLPAQSPYDANVMKQALAAYRSGEKVASFTAWLSEAQRGIAEAQTRAALLYARGEGTKQDAIEAYRWLRLAAAQGNQSAWIELPLVAAQLSPAERAMGESLVRTPNGAQNKPP